MHSYDVALIGAGIMSTTVAALLAELEPHWSIVILEQHDAAARESTEVWNNAGTGHAALCELNYTPRTPSGEITVAKAAAINEQFHVSRQLWSHWVERKILGPPRSFINTLPHMSFVSGEEGARFLRDRYEAMRREPVFAQLEHTEDPETIQQWAPLLMRGRTVGKQLAASRLLDGTDVDFGQMSRQIANTLAQGRAEIHYGHRVTSLQQKDDRWRLQMADSASGHRFSITAKYVFVGAGGGTLPLLQSAKIPEIRGYGGFPVAGQFLRTTDPSISNQHTAKVYGLPAPGAPPMSVPHLDTRFVGGKRHLMFGPYAGFSTKYLKHGSPFALLHSLRTHNVGPMLDVAGDRRDLMYFLLKELSKNKRAKTDQLLDFYPTAEPQDWELITAGQRVQVIKPGPRTTARRSRGTMELFGTELVIAAQGRLAGVLGASPGASTAPEIAIRLLRRCFPMRLPHWNHALKQMVPSLDRRLNDDVDLLEEVTRWTSRTLGLNEPRAGAEDLKVR